MAREVERVDSGYRTMAIGTPSGRFGMILDRGAIPPDRLTAAREAAVEAVCQLNRDVGIPGHLREVGVRKEDIPALAGYFLAQKAARYGRPIGEFQPGAVEALLTHTWPGNVRELEHVIERAVILAEDGRVRFQDLQLRSAPTTEGSLEAMTLVEAEAHLIRKALERHQGNVTLAAEALGLSRSALYRRLQSLGLKVQE